MQWIIQHKLLCLLILAGIFTFLWLWTQRKRIRLHPLLVLPLSACHVLVGVFCVKAFAALEAGSLNGLSGMSLFGAVFFLPVFYWLGAKLTKRPVKDVFDLFVVPMVFTLACARVNCLLSGCCLGLPMGNTGLRWPTREAELVYYAVILSWMIPRILRRKNGGELYPVYMITYGAFRLITEFFRVSRSGTLVHLSHLWAVLCFITGLSVFLEQRRRRRTVLPKHDSDRRK